MRLLGVQLAIGHIQLQSSTQQFYTLQMQSAFSIETFVLVLILMSYVCTAQFLQVRQLPYVHQSVVAILLGALTAILIKLVFHQSIMFSNQMFFIFILPPIIFSAGYSLRKSLFFQHISLIGFLGVLGTIFTFIVLSACISFINHILFDRVLTMREVMMLSSVLCATDTVTALSLVKAEEAPTLNSVLFGEGVLNDAVAIIMFRSVSTLTFSSSQGLSTPDTMFLIGSFFYLLIFSLTIGLVFGFGLSYILRINKSLTKTPLKQSSLILLTGYSSYLLSELLDLSGIISLFTCSVVMGHYCYLNLSEESQRGTLVAFDSVGYLVEGFVYAYLGVCILGIEGYMSAMLMAVLVVLALPLSRAIPVYILPLFYIIFRKQFPLTNKQTNVCWYAGLIRGAIAFALSLQITSKNSEFIRSVTLIIVLITTILGSVFMKVFMKDLSRIEEQQLGTSSADRPSGRMGSQSEIRDSRIGVTATATVTQSNYNLREQPNSPEKVIPGQQVLPTAGPAQQQSRWQAFQNKYIIPIFTRIADEQTAAANTSVSRSDLKPIATSSVVSSGLRTEQ